MILDAQDRKDLERYRDIVNRRGSDWKFYKKAIEYLENGKKRDTYVNRGTVASRAIEIIRKLLKVYTAKEIIRVLNLSCDYRDITRLSAGSWVKKSYMEEILSNYNKIKPEV